MKDETNRKIGLTVRIHNGHDVKVKFVNQSLDVGICTIFSQELPGHIFNRLYNA